MFYAVVVLVGLGVVVTVAGDLRRARYDASFFVIFGLLVIFELRPLFTAGSRDANGLSTSTMFVFALLLHWGLAVAIAGQAVGVLLESSLSRKAAWRPLFNIAQYALCLAAAQVILDMFHDGSSPGAQVIMRPAMLLVILAAGGAWFVVNSLLVGTLISFRFGTGWWKEMMEDVGVFGLSSGATIALAPLVVLAIERSAWMVPLIVVPLYAVYKNSAVSIVQQHQASHDALTGLPNRQYFTEEAQHRLGSPSPTAQVYLFLLDLDRFKEVNDTHGHRVGDRLLQQTAERLTSAVRPGDLVARLGGDEFALLLNDVVNEAEANSLADRITSALSRPFLIDGLTLDARASIGMARAPRHGGDPGSLLHRADLAMYAAKRQGRPYASHTPDVMTDNTSPSNPARRACVPQPRR
ncbi:MAG: diguanylate cyclase [Actinomycetota bacterium]|nr:diguanylate cyclase [Actinomycetota bacterium]